VIDYLNGCKFYFSLVLDSNSWSSKVNDFKSSFSSGVSSVLDYSAWKMKLNSLAFDFRNSRPTFPSVRNISLIAVGGTALSALIYAAYRCLSPFSSFTCLISYEFIPKNLLVTIQSGEAVHHFNLMFLLDWFINSGSTSNPANTLPVPQNVLEQIASWMGWTSRDITDLISIKPIALRQYWLLRFADPMFVGITPAQRRNRIMYLEHMRGIL